MQSRRDYRAPLLISLAVTFLVILLLIVAFHSGNDAIPDTTTSRVEQLGNNTLEPIGMHITYLGPRNRPVGSVLILTATSHFNLEEIATRYQHTQNGDNLYIKEHVSPDTLKELARYVVETVPKDRLKFEQLAVVRVTLIYRNNHFVEYYLHFDDAMSVYDTTIQNTKNTNPGISESLEEHLHHLGQR